MGIWKKLHSPSLRRSLSQNVLSFKCRLLNLRRLSDKKIEHLTSAPMLFILGKIWEFDRSSLKKLFLMAKNMSQKSDRKTLINQAIEYVMTLRSDVPWKIISEVEQEVLGKESCMIKPFQFSIDRATEKGIEKGLKKGIKKGREEGIEDVALNMLKEGMNVSQVSKITGMSKDKIKALQTKKAS